MEYCEQDLASLLDNMQQPFTEAQVGSVEFNGSRSEVSKLWSTDQERVCEGCGGDPQ